MNFNITTFLEKYYKNNESIILACSTGPDSMFLLYQILQTKYKNNLVACYFNHKLRKQADEEEKFLLELGKKEGFKVEIAEADIKAIKEKFYPNKGIEEVGRMKRYDFFDAIMHIYKTDKIILAHHLDDKIETFFFNLARGTKLTGLINMTEKSGNILRPLLNLEKKEILKYLDENDLKYFIDETNTDTDFKRNFLRLEIIPKFEEINGNYKENISNLMNYLEDVKQNIDEEVKRFLHNQKRVNEELVPLNEGEDSQSESGGVFEISAFNLLSNFMQKEVIRYIYFISNGNSTIGLSEANIAEVLKFINGKNNKTIKEIGNMKLKKENRIILY